MRLFAFYFLKEIDVLSPGYQRENGSMWKLPVVLVSMTVALAACQTTPQERGALTGGAIGAGTGAVVGAIAGGTATSAAVGAAVGGAAGAIIGAVANRPGYCYAYDRYGNRVIVECPPGYGG
jgi:hypothetical protein